MGPLLPYYTYFDGNGNVQDVDRVLDPEIVAIFRAEVEERVASLTAGLLALEGGSATPEALKPLLGPDTDVPAGDINVGGREIGFMYGQYRRLMDRVDGLRAGRWGRDGSRRRSARSCR